MGAAKVSPAQSTAAVRDRKHVFTEVTKLYGSACLVGMGLPTRPSLENHEHLDNATVALQGAQSFADDGAHLGVLVHLHRVAGRGRSGELVAGFNGSVLAGDFHRYDADDGQGAFARKVRAFVRAAEQAGL